MEKEKMLATAQIVSAIISKDTVANGGFRVFPKYAQFTHGVDVYFGGRDNGDQEILLADKSYPAQAGMDLLTLIKYVSRCLDEA